MIACACFGFAGEQAGNASSERGGVGKSETGDKNLGDILDDLDVPAYDFLCG
jgi:hypothetical protein